jgi:hypothetical protein
VHGEVRVGFGEFGEEFVRVGLVDVVPEGFAAGVGGGYVFGSCFPERVRYVQSGRKAVMKGRIAHLP